jgi:hypothetical protein
MVMSELKTDAKKSAALIKKYGSVRKAIEKGK